MTNQEMNILKVQDRIGKEKNLLAISRAIKELKNLDRAVSSTLQQMLLDLMLLKNEKVTIGQAQAKIQLLSRKVKKCNS